MPVTPSAKRSQSIRTDRGAPETPFAQASIHSSMERLEDYVRRNVDTARKAFRAGVRIIMGSDAVYNGWGLNTRELDWFVKIGMTPEQALKTATTTPATMLGMEKNLGAVAPGFLADIVCRLLLEK